MNKTYTILQNMIDLDRQAEKAILSLKDTCFDRRWECLASSNESILWQVRASVLSSIERDVINARHKLSKWDVEQSRMAFEARQNFKPARELDTTTFEEVLHTFEVRRSKRAATVWGISHSERFWLAHDAILIEEDWPAVQFEGEISIGAKVSKPDVAAREDFALACINTRNKLATQRASLAG